MQDLLTDWGAFLEIALYQEALVHFLGGESKLVCQTPVRRNGVDLGCQKAYHHGKGIVFRLTAFTEHLKMQELHLQRWLKHTEFSALQWLNLCHTHLAGVTIRKDAT